MFNTKLDNMTVETLINIIEGKQSTRSIDLKPLYQRKVVWPNEMKSDFINSVYNGIIPTNIILNKKSKKLVCIDGKQRLSSLLDFKNNKIPVIIKDVEVYFDSTKEINVNDQIAIRIMTDEEKCEFFLDRSIPVCFYQNLSYEEETDIFHRIQSSKILHSGEKIFCLFKNEDVANYFRTYCESIKHLFSKTHNNLERYDYVIEIVDMMYMNLNGKYELFSSPKKRDKYLTKLDNITKIKDAVLRIKPLINFYYSDQLLNNDALNIKELYTSVRLCILYLLNKTGLIPKIKYNDQIFELIKYVLKKSKKNKINKRSKTDLEQIDKYFQKIYKKQCKEMIESDNDSSSESDNYSSCESDNDSSSESTIKNNIVYP